MALMTHQTNILREHCSIFYSHETSSARLNAFEWNLHWVCIGKHSSEAFPIQDSETNTLSPLFLHFTLDYVIRKADESQE
jgi:hypothetical protein